MKKHSFFVSAAALVGAAGLAGSSLAALTVTPSDIITWGGVGQGRAVPTPGGFTSWVWTNTLPGNPQIDASGRVYFTGSVTSTPAIGSLTAPRGMFTATNSTDIGLYNGLYDSAPLGGGVLVGQQSSTGVFNSSGFNGNIWTSGNRIMHGTGVQGTGIVNTGTTQNNSWLETSTFGGSSSTIVQRNNTITLNSAAGGTALGNITTDFKNLSQQNAAMNSSGTIAWSGAVAAVAGVFVTTNPTVAPFGNNKFLAVTPAGGSAQVIAQGGDAAPGGGTYANGGSNGAGGFNVKMNGNGQVFFDGTRVVAGTVTTSSDSIGMIYTPGSGTQRVYREGLVASDASGLPNADGQLHNGAMNTGRYSFSNAGVLYTTTLISGTNLNTTGINQNDSGLWIANTSGSTRVVQRNDTAPGFTPAQNVRMGSINQSSIGMNNSGFTSFGTTLQGESITASVGAVVSGGFPGVPAVVVTPGTFGNDSAVVAGVAGSLQVIARKGDPAPGTPGFSLSPEIGGLNMRTNNANQIIFDCDVTPYQVGDSMGVTGQLLATSVLASTRVLYGWTPPTGLVPLMYVGQVMEVDAGIFKTVTQWSFFGESNGDGASGALNDLGQFTGWVRYSDNSWSVIKLTVPAPSAGALALLGLGAMARRRRRN